MVMKKFLKKFFGSHRRKKTNKRMHHNARELSYPLMIELLEERIVPSAVVAHWIGDSGSWSDPTHWDIGVAPNNSGATTYQAIIDVSGTPTITVDQSVTISSLNNAETVIVGAGTTTIAQQTVNSGAIQVTAGTAQLNLSGAINDTGEISATTGILSLSNATLTADGSNSRVTANGSATLNSVNLYATNGGIVSLLGATTFTSNYYGNTLQASGAGSKIDLSALTSFTGSTYNSTQIKALSGGEVDLAGEFSGNTTWTLDGTGGVLNASAVTKLSDATLNVSGGQTLLLGGATALTNVNLNATSGGAILFPVATTFTSNYYSNTLQASGAGSKIDLSALTSFTGSTYNSTQIKALSGGEVDLAGDIHNNNTITIDGAESVLNITAVTKFSATTITASNGYVLRLPATNHIQWGAGNTLSTSGTGSKIINGGLISANGVTLTVAANDFTNIGTLEASNGGTLDINGPVAINGSGRLAGTASGTLTISGSLLGDTHNADLYAPQATLRFDGAGTASSPQLLEAMGRDAGSDPAGFMHNFAYSTLALSNNTYVRLVDQSDNAAGAGAEVLYVNSLLVPAGTTLDLNGLHLYVRAAQVSGTIVGGTVTQIPDSGPIVLATATPGSIAVSGELDEWTFFARAGRSVTVVVNPGSGGSPAPLAPYLSYAQVQLLDGANNVMATATGSSNGQIVALSDVALPADGTYRIQVRASAGHSANTGNYFVTLWDVTADVYPLVLNQQRTGSIETPYSVDRWTFSAVASQQVRFDLVNTSATGTVFDLTGPSSWTGFSDIAADSDLITLPTSGSYTLTAHGTGAQYGGTYAFKLAETPMADLNLGEIYTGQFAGSGQAQLFKINVPQAGQLLIKLDDSANNNVNEIYASFDAPPTRGDYDLRGTVAASADQTLFAPMAYSGTWYVLVYGNTIRTPSSYTLTATTADVSIISITPDHYAATADAQITVTGAGFVNGTTVELVSSGGMVYAASKVDIDSFEQVTTTFAAGSVPADTANPYSLRVTRPGAVPASLADCFTMKPTGEAHLETRLILPSSVGRHAVATLYVEYANTGDVSMSAPLLVLVSGDPDGSDRPLMTLDQSRLSGGFWTSAIPEGFSESVQFLASGSQPGILGPGESGRMPVYYAGLLTPWDFSDTRVEFVVGVLDPSSTITVDWNSLKDSIRPDYVQADAWEAIWANFTAAAGPTWGSYLSMLDENAQYLDRLGEETNEIARLLGFELRQADALNPIRYLASATDAVVDSPAMDITFSRAYAQPISRRYEIGPLGRGWADNWQYSLTAATDSTVTVTDPTGTPRIFQPDTRHTGQYLSAPGDYGQLTTSAGGYILREQDGTVFAFRSDGKLDYTQESNGNRITCGYTGDLLTNLTVSTGQSLQIGYNAAGRIVSITDPDGRQAQFTYDAANEHLIAVQEYDGRITQYSYVTGQGAAREHALAQITYPDGTHRYFTYEANGRLARTFLDGNAEAIQFSYDSAGTVTATNALGDPAIFYFDDWGTIVKATNALGNSVTLTLDDLRNLTGVTDPAGRKYAFEYDSQGDFILYVDTMGAATNFTYTADFHELQTLTDANGDVTHYTYDAHGNLTGITYANGSSEHWAYDALGQVTEWTNQRGRAIDVQWDADGHLTHKTYADGTHVDYTYDTRGNLTSATDSTGTTSFTYGANDYLTRIDYPGEQWLEFTYDVGGRRVSSTDQLGHELHYQYDSAGRLSGITDESSVQVVRYEYDIVGRLSRKTLGNGVYTTYGYDAAGELLHLVNYASDGSVLSHFDYTYDSRGRRTEMATSYGTWTYEYDDIGQLTHAVLVSTDPSVPSQDLRYVYDGVGNRIYIIENGVRTDYTTNSLNQYTKVGDTTYAFDADGNLLSETSLSGTTTYTYDDENRLIAVHKGADSWTYRYDAFEQRMQMTHNGDATNYIIDPIGLGNVVGEYDGSGNLIARYDYGFGLLSRTNSAGVPAWYTFDALGNTSELTDAAGVVASSYVYAPFGTLLEQTGTVANPFQFVGKWDVTNDGNGLNFMRARYYEPELGRFISQDPIGINGGVNFYRYAYNSPVMLVDPLGFCTGAEDSLENSAAEFVWESMINPTNVWIGAVAGGILGAGIAFVGGVPVGSVLFTGWVMGGMGVGATIGGAYSLGDALTNLLKDVIDQMPRFPNLMGGISNGSYCGPSSEPAAPPNPATNPGGEDSSGAAGGFDPNQKLGPAGFETAGFIRPDIAFPYRIDFENEPSATAPAQQVVITDQLDSELNWDSFELTEIGFGDQLIAVPDNTQHFETTVPMSYNGVGFEVQTEAGINYATGVIYATFYSIDPNTGLPPDVLIGFLPPEDGTGRGMGHISYVIDPKAGLITGTEIRNVALISFDGQPQIATNQVDPHDPSKGTDPDKECLNTIDAGLPSSAVSPLPQETYENEFTVSWSGNDDEGGSGISAYAIYVSIDDASYTLWLDNTSETSAPYAGDFGHSYAFYSVARDNVGHVESIPPGPDTFTTLILLEREEKSVTINPGQFILFNYESGGEGSAYGIVANAGDHSFKVDLEYGQGSIPDSVGIIHLSSEVDGVPQTVSEVVIVNTGIPGLDDSFVGKEDTVNATLITGLSFLPDPSPGNGNLQVQFGGQTYSLAPDGNLTELNDTNNTTMALNQVSEVQAHSSNITGDIAADHWGTINFIEWNGYAGIDIRAAGEDPGDIIGDRWGISGDVEKIWLRDGSISYPEEAADQQINIFIGGTLKTLIVSGKMEQTNLGAKGGIGSIEVHGDLIDSSIWSIDDIGGIEVAGNMERSAAYAARGIQNVQVHGQLASSRIYAITANIDNFIADGNITDSGVYAAIAVGNIEATNADSLHNSFIVGVKQGEVKAQGVEVAIHILDTDKKTAYPDQMEMANIKGSKGITARVVVVSSEGMEYIAGVEVDGKGRLSLESNATDLQAVGIADDGSRIDIKSIVVPPSVVAQSVGYLVNLSGIVEQVTISADLLGVVAKGPIRDIEARNIDRIISTEGDIQRVKAGSVHAGYIHSVCAGKGLTDITAGAIGEIRALLGDVTKIVSDHDIESIWAGKSVKNVQTIDGSIGAIFARGDIKDISVMGNIKLLSGRSVIKINAAGSGNIGEILAEVDAKDIMGEGEIAGKIFAKRDVSKVSVMGNIHLIEAIRDAKTIGSDHGSVKVIAHRDALGIEGADGIVYYGRKYAKISENLSLEKMG